MNTLSAHTLSCPYCWEPNDIIIDPTDEQHRLIEDCQVCCNPMQIGFEVDDGAVVSVSVERSQ